MPWQMIYGWPGPDLLLWKANLTHEMCMALARTVATKLVLRAVLKMPEASGTFLGNDGLVSRQVTLW